MTNPTPADAGTQTAALDAARKRIAAAVRAEAARGNVTQKEIARVLSLPPSSVSLRWHGTRAFAAEELDAVAGLIGVPVSRLYETHDDA